MKFDRFKKLILVFTIGSIALTEGIRGNLNDNGFYLHNDSSRYGIRSRKLPENTAKITKPVYIRQSPGNEATMINAGNGLIKIFFINRPGTADKMMSIASSDNGMTWSEPIVEFPLPGEAYYANNLVKGSDGEIYCIFHIWGKGENGYNGRHLDLYHCHTENKGEKWTKPQKIYDGYVGSIRGFIQLKNNRLVLVFARAVPSRNQKPIDGTPDYGWNEIISMYSDDLGDTWMTSENGVNILVESTQVTRYGGVEPEIIELNNNKIWMLIRTNKGHMYESFSENSGKTWLDPKPTSFISSDSPADLIRLSDDRIVILWSGNQRWDDPRSYANGGREILHSAISGDDGKTWKGYREVLMSPSGHFEITRDIGTAYPSGVETEEGKILFLSGQAEERAIVSFDPSWLEKSSASDNFKEGLAQWTLFGASSGTCISALPGKGSALLITKSEKNKDLDTEAIWNFPMMKKGKLVMDVSIKRGSKGINLALTDHFSVSYDTNASRFGVISVPVLNNKNTVEIHDAKIIITWDCSTEKASVYLGRELIKEISFQRKTDLGLNYLRVGIPGNESDTAGFFIKSVKMNSSK
jgi:hypothetical protein